MTIPSLHGRARPGHWMGAAVSADAEVRGRIQVTSRKSSNLGVTRLSGSLWVSERIDIIDFQCAANLERCGILGESRDECRRLNWLEC